MAEERKLNGVNARSLKGEKAVDERDGGAGRIEIHFDRVAIWALLFTDTFFVTYFFAKLFQWI